MADTGGCEDRAMVCRSELNALEDDGGELGRPGGRRDFDPCDGESIDDVGVCPLFRFEGCFRLGPVSDRKKDQSDSNSIDSKSDDKGE